MKSLFRLAFTAWVVFSLARISFCQIRQDQVIPGAGFENLGSTMIDEKLIPKMIQLKVLYVRLADNDGNQYSFFSKSQAEEQIASGNKVYNPSGIQLILDPSSDFTGYYEGNIQDTVMNNECPAYASGSVETAQDKLKNITQKDLNKDGKSDWKDSRILCKADLMDAKRAAYALQFSDKIVVFIRGGNDWSVYYDEKLGHWVLDPFAVRAYSGKNVYYVALSATTGGLPHEIGHYLHLPHTNPYKIDTVEIAKEEIKKYILKHEKEPEFNPQTDGLNVFDNDGIYDTPPDAGRGIFESFYGEAWCLQGKQTIPMDVTVKSKTYHFTLAPDLKNIMSYAVCISPTRITPGQKKVVKKALFELNRQPLVRPELVSCYKNKGIDKGLLLGNQREEQTLSELEKLVKKRLEIIESCLNGKKSPFLKIDVKNLPKIKLPLNELPPPTEMD